MKIKKKCKKTWKNYIEMIPASNNSKENENEVAENKSK